MICWIETWLFSFHPCFIILITIIIITTKIIIMILYSNKWIRRCFTKSHIMNYIHWQDCSTVAGKIVQQSLARLFNSHWHDSLTITGTILQESRARFLNSDWHDSSTVTGRILQQSWGRFFLFSMLAEFFNSQDHVLKNRAMHQEYDTWS